MALASEFQRKQQMQAKQFQDAQQPASNTPKEHPEDILMVRNILVDDDTEINDNVPYANARQGTDPNTGQPHFINQIETNLFEHSWNTRDFFEVRWDGRPHRIKPGDTRRFPRYLADHFAKHLIDFILIERENKERVTGLLKNASERAKLYKAIVIGVDTYYNGDLYGFGREGQYVEEQVTDLNSPQVSNAPIHDLGGVPPVALGYGTTDAAPEPIDDPLLTPPADAVDTTVPPINPVHPDQPTNQEQLIASKTIAELRQEAKQLGIKVEPTMNKETLAAAILNF